MLNQEHSGLGDNVAGNKYENIIRSVQTRDLGSVIDSIMICSSQTGHSIKRHFVVQS